MPTLTPSDAPDWLSVPGGARLAGSIVLSGTGTQEGTLTVNPTTFDGGLYMLILAGTNGGQTMAAFSVTETGTGLVVLSQPGFRALDPPLLAFISRELGPAWDVFARVIYPGAGGPYNNTVYVFTLPTFPIVRTDQYLATWRRVPYDSTLFHRPAAATQAIVTFPATTGRRWIVDEAVFTLRTAAATVNAVVAQVQAAGTVVWEQVLTTQAVIGHLDRIVMGPGWGIIGTPGGAVSVQFNVAGAASSFEVVSASAYYA